MNRNSRILNEKLWIIQTHPHPHTHTTHTHTQRCMKIHQDSFITLSFWRKVLNVSLLFLVHREGSKWWLITNSMPQALKFEQNQHFLYSCFNFYSQVFITFRDINIENCGEDCIYNWDTLTIYDCNIEDPNRQIAHFCGQNYDTPISLKSSGTNMLVLFKTDLSIVLRGYEVEFYFVPGKYILINLKVLFNKFRVFSKWAHDFWIG